MRFLYTILGLTIGLTLASMHLDTMFNAAFSRSAGRIYQLGCGQGIYSVTKTPSYDMIQKCYIISSGFQNVLEEILSK